jgi:hypothetical protein
MSNCIFCNEQTSNPKFCSRSCAAKYNNVLYPKRTTESRCKICNDKIWKGKTYCKHCWQRKVEENSIAKWDSTTLKEMIFLGNANAGGRYPYIRTLARQKYIKSDKPKQCLICNYSLHFDVAHVKAIKDFPLSATIGEINNLNNLEALCKNHHWEYDHGHITLEGRGFIL